jgi:hypothetical protein
MRRPPTEVDRLRGVRDIFERDCEQYLTRWGYPDVWRKLADAQFDFRLAQLRFPDSASDMSYGALGRVLSALSDMHVRGYAGSVNVQLMIYRVNQETEKAFPTLGPTEAIGSFAELLERQIQLAEFVAERENEGGAGIAFGALPDDSASIMRNLSPS